jgi:hypothetical protein
MTTIKELRELIAIWLHDADETQALGESGKCDEESGWQTRVEVLREVAADLEEIIDEPPTFASFAR